MGVDFKELGEIFKSKGSIVATLNKAFDVLKVTKQLDAVQDRDIEKKIKEFRDASYVNASVSGNNCLTVLSSMNDFLSKLQNIDIKDEKAIDVLSLTYHDVIVRAFHSIIVLFAVVMDVFTLARLFRTFKDGTTVKNALIYTGNAHTLQYYKFLTQILGFSLLSESIDPTDSNCIQLSDDTGTSSLSFFGVKANIDINYEPSPYEYSSDKFLVQLKFI